MRSDRAPRIPGGLRALPSLLLVVVLLAVAPTAGAPGPPSGTGTPGAERQQGEQEEPRFDATISRVRVDVQVTDDDGEFVDDLAAEDFRLFEDGEEQEILDVQVVEVGGSVASGPSAPGEVDASGRRAEVEAEGSEPRGGAPDGAPRVGERTRAADELAAMVFLIDGPSLSHRNRGRFVDALREMSEEAGEFDVPRALYLLDNVGSLRQIVPLTRDPEELTAGIDLLGSVAQFDNSLQRRLEEFADTPVGGDQGGGPGGAPGSRRGLAQLYELEERSRSFSTLDVVEQFAHALAARPGRTALVWVSTGVKLMRGSVFAAQGEEGDLPDDLLPGQDQPTATTDGEMAIFSPDTGLIRAQERLHRAANSSNVSIYAVDPTPMVERRGVRTTLSGERGAGFAALQDFAFESLSDSLREASRETGGRSYIGWTDLDRALREIEADNRRFYLLTYAAPPPDGDGEYHEIRVEVLRDDVDVRARRGYVDYDPATRRARAVDSAVALPGTVRSLPVRAEAFRGWTSAQEQSVLLAVAVHPGDVEVGVDRQGRTSANLEFHLYAVDSDGEIVAQSHEGVVGHAAGTAESSAGEGLRRRPDRFLVHQQEWELDPDRYELRVAVVDRVSGRVGGARVETRVGSGARGARADTTRGAERRSSRARGDEGRASPWAPGDPMVVSEGPEGDIQPAVDGRVFAGHRATAYLTLRGGRSPVLGGTIYTTAQERAGEEGREIFALPMRSVAPGLHRGAVPLPSGLPPGDYVLQLALTDPGAGRYRIFRIRLHVLEPDGAPPVSP